MEKLFNFVINNQKLWFSLGIVCTIISIYFMSKKNGDEFILMCLITVNFVCLYMYSVSNTIKLLSLTLKKLSLILLLAYLVGLDYLFLNEILKV